jgi:hypothetical protein
MPTTIVTALAVVFAISSSALAGRFVVTANDYSSLHVTYQGEVLDGDHKKWEAIEQRASNRVIYLTIESGGGSAYEGIRLYWTLQDYPYLVTKASRYGAYSAAAIMWLAGDVREVPKGTIVAFHSAYCTWDPQGTPSIGCDTSDFQIHLINVLDNAGYNGRAFNALLNEVQAVFGTDGWIAIHHEGWTLWDSTDDDIFYFNPAWVGGEVLNEC